jgi:acyl-coenzyme A synthetase/AMP-(fatty) acid ligase
MTEHDWIDWNAVVPTATAVVAEGQALSYARFKADVEQLHAALCQSGGAVGHRVGVVFKHEYWNWVGHLAAAKLGAAVLSLRERDAVAVSRAFALDMVLCDADMTGWPESLVIVRQKLNSVDDPVVVNAGVSTGLKPSDRADAHVSTSPVARLTLTSGTTGRSRSVAWTRAQTLQRVDQVGESLTEKAKTRLYSFQHIGTTGGFRYPLATWRLGGTVYLRGLGVSFQDTWPCLSQSNVLTMAPANLRLVLQHWPELWPGQSDRMLILSGGRVSVPLRDHALQKVGRHMLLAYGSTEAGSAATGDAALIDRHPGAVGHVREGVVVEIVDEQDQPLPRGTAGTVRIRTPYMVNTYERLPGQLAEASVQAFREGWFYPGDQGVLEDDGFLSILGRLGDVVNLGGAKVSLPDLEQRMEGLPGVQDFCLLALPLPDGDRLAVVVVPQQDAPSPAMHDWIKKALRRNVPYVLLRMDKIERNEMGKVPRKAFAEKLLPRVISQMQKQKR